MIPRASLHGIAAIEVLGRGGMGIVWRAEHRATGTPLAVKVMNTDAPVAESAMSAFEHEVRVVAALDHPSIVRIVEYGLVDTDSARDGMPAGSPFFAMELAQGELDPDPSDWPSARAALIAILRGLAHAHARGVIHRDLKPANVLRFSTKDNSKCDTRLALSDFGIAYALGTAGASQQATIIGTPDYMAPEQIAGSAREFGPWTDLFALGCIGFEMLTGGLPFENVPLVRRAANADARRAPFVPRFDVPLDVGDWIDSLLRADPMLRPRSAADALFSLEALGRAVPLAQVTNSNRARRNLPTAATEALRADAAPTVAQRSDGAASHGASMSQALLTRSAAAPSLLPVVVEDFMQDALLVPASIPGVGLGLWGLRVVPLVDRERERADLAGSLLAACDERAARVVVLRGAPGVGKSRLGTWIVERASELGVADGIVSTAAANPTSRDGLLPAIVRTLGLDGLARAQFVPAALRALLARGVPATDADLLAHALAGMSHTQDDGIGPHLFDSRERVFVVSHAISALSRWRPMVVWIDDAQWADDDLDALVRTLETPDVSALFVLAVRDEVRDARGHACMALDAIGTHARAKSLTVESLSLGDQRALLRGALPLDGSLEETLVQRTGGHPRLGLQMVGDWVERGVLQPGPHGFCVREGADIATPADVYALCTASLERYVAETHGSALHALEVCAALGGDVAHEEWHACVERAGVAMQRFWVDLAARRGLLRVSKTVVSVAHGLLCETLERSARDGGRWGGLHRACAAALIERDDGEPRTAVRIARHLCESGEAQAALEPWLRAADGFRSLYDFAPAHAALDSFEAQTAILSVARDDARAVSAAILRGRLFALQGSAEDAARAIGVLSSDLGAYPPSLRSAAAWTHGAVAQLRGEMVDARAQFERCTSIADACGDDIMSVHGRQALGNLFKLLGDLDRAIVVFEAAVTRAEVLGDRLPRGALLNAFAEACVYRGDTGRALALAERARVDHLARGHRYGVAECENTLGEAARLAGDFATAEVHYRESLRMVEGVSNRHAIAMRINLGLTMLADRRVEQARAILLAAESNCSDSGMSVYLVFARTALLAASAALGDWDHCHELLLALEPKMRSPSLFHRDLAWSFGQAADYAARGERRDIEARARALATAQRRVLSR